jgi:glycosyltransferase involved in cell wall biosynthesis
MSTTTITAVIFAKNEENNIKECIDSVPKEMPILVVDSFSSDQTRILAEKAGVRVVDFKWNGKYPRKKEWTRRQFSEDEWLLLLDADMRCTPEIYAEARKIVESGRYSAASIEISYWFMGKELKHGSRPSYLGLINIGNTEYPDVELDNLGYGDIEFHYQPKCDGRIAKMKGKIHHRDRDALLSWIERHVKYANYQAELQTNPEINKKLISHKTFRGKILYHLPLKSTAQFLYAYIIKFGFLDGLTGFRFAYLLAHHYYLAKVLVIDKREKKLKKKSDEHV